MNSERTLGEVGYEAYRAYSGGKSLITGMEIPSFAQLPPNLREAWEVVARHIAAASIGRVNADARSGLASLD
jgi:hypothetical protein